ncbi:MAG: sugar ABC transporter permease [Sumerlaeia bacterium]
MRDQLEAFAYLAPAGLILLIFWFLPVLLALIVSFFDATALTPIGDFNWVGLSQYTRAFQDEDFVQSLWNTLNYTVYSVPPTLALSLIAALLLNSKIKGRAFFRTAFFLPYVTTWVAISIVWTYLFNREAGLANWLFRVITEDILGGSYQDLAWLAEPKGIFEMMFGYTVPDLALGLNAIPEGPSLAMFCIIVTSIWRDIGYFMIIFLAGLQSIDHSYYEAADIDGATPFQKFWAITFPLLSPVTFFLLVISMIGAFKIFVPMLVMTPDGGPDGTTSPIVFYMYSIGFTGQWELSYASAIAYILTIIILVLTVAQNRVFGKKVEYGQ